MATQRVVEVHRFTARLERGDAPGTTTFVRVPTRVMEAFAPRKRVPVIVVIAGRAWRTTTATYGDASVVPVRSEIRALVGASAGG